MDAARQATWARWGNGVMLVAALLVVPVVIIDETNQSGPVATVSEVLNWIIWIAFAAELVILLARTPDRRAWLWRHPLEIAIVLLTPPFLPGILQALRAARLFRVLRLLRLLRTARFGRDILSPQSLAWATVLTGLVVIGGGIAFVEAEHAQHLSLDDGVWWALSTVTTVGYGDIYPHTDAGRMIAGVVMLSGIGFVAFLTAAAAQRFIVTAEAVETEETQILQELRELRQQVDALSKAIRSP